jgi:hypothetical protein
LSQSSKPREAWRMSKHWFSSRAAAIFPLWLLGRKTLSPT